ncbi:MAG: hemolysin family protein [Bacteroidota bacterium]
MDADSSSPLVGLLLTLWPVAAGTATVATEATLFVLLLVLSAFFSGSEVALFSLSASDREALSEDDSKGARRVLALLERPRRLLIGILIMNNLVNVAAAILATVLTVQAAEAYEISKTTLLVFQVVVLTFLLLVLSEITPKLVATQQNRRWATLFSGPLYLVFRVLYPASNLLAHGMDLVQRRFRTQAAVVSNEDLKTLADLGEADGTLEEEERALIHSIVEFGETTVRAVMVSRVDVHALPDTATLDEALTLIRETGHSRFPLYREHLDDVLGILYAKDLIPLLDQEEARALGSQPADWERIARPAKFVPLGCPLDAMLADFQTSNTHIAVVVDEYGGTAGVVTLEDILEEIVGEIRDEHDLPEALPYERVGPQTFRVDAGIDLDDLLESFEVEVETEAFDFETLGGLIFHLTGEIPEPGTVTEYGPLTLRVEELDNNRIKQVLVEISPRPLEEAEERKSGRAEEKAER